ncbi:hypothetical protein ACFSC4_15190 [Deinococcus malanensis]|uniref:hypothetical protein n=1 Tax=Deinococcus malanensis TaxID=1706855 RepID=UPI001668F339|nr:hypothetical protein [Deinococcus malanensis]
MRRLVVLGLWCAAASGALATPVVPLQAGSVQTVAVHLRLSDWLLSRETPNEVRVHTP